MILKSKSKLLLMLSRKSIFQQNLNLTSWAVWVYTYNDTLVVLISKWLISQFTTLWFTHLPHLFGCRICHKVACYTNHIGFLSFLYLFLNWVAKCIFHFLEYNYCKVSCVVCSVAKLQLPLVATGCGSKIRTLWILALFQKLFKG